MAEHRQDSSRCIGAMEKRWLCHKAPTPMFFVSVAFKGLRYCASSLFATHTRGLRSVASKGLRLHQNCADFRHFRCFSALGLRRGTCGGRLRPSLLRVDRGGEQRRLREARGEANRASWRLIIKDYGSTDIRMNCGKLGAVPQD